LNQSLACSVEFETGEGGTVVLRITGALDLSGSAVLVEAIDRLSAPGPVVIDISGLGFVDSAGFKRLLEAHARRPFVLLGDHPVVQSLLEMADRDGREEPRGSAFRLDPDGPPSAG
jgi:anti-anti-sigma factor